MKTIKIRKSDSFPKMKCIYFIAMICLLFPMRSIADDNDTLRHFSLDTLVVSAGKFDNIQWNLPTAGTMLSGETLHEKQLFEMKDFTAAIPNFIMTDRDSKRTASVFVRGIGTLINTPGVAMYVDGIPHFEKSSFDINLNNIEKITFLRGPQGTLYGRNAMGGIILLQTKSPFVHQGTRLNLRYGSYNDAYAAVSHAQKINNQWAYSVAGSYDYFGGYILNTFSGKKADKMHSGAISTRLEWRPNTELSFRLFNNFEKVHQGAFSYGDVNENGYVDSVSTNHPSHYDRTIYDGGLQTDYRNNLFWLRAHTSLQSLRDVYNVDQDASPRELYHAVQHENHFLLSQEINIKGLNTGMYNWHFGMFGFNHNVDRSTDVHMNMTKPPYLLEKRYDEYFRGFAVYHQSDIFLTSNLKMELGLRYDYEHAHSSYHDRKIINGEKHPGDEYHTPLSFSEWSPKATLQYFFNPHAHLYATVAKGYKSGGYNTVIKSENTHAFLPEKSWNYEIGTKASLFNHRLNAELALFYITINNQQVKQIIDLHGAQISNAVKSVSKGFECALQAMPTTNIRINASYGYTHATFKNYVYSDKVDYAGNFIPFVPRHTFNAGAQYILPLKHLASDNTLRFSINYRGIGKIYWKEDNVTEQPYYGLLDASIAWHKARTTFSVWAKNITNTKYLGYYFEMQKRHLGKPGKPFTMGASVALSF